MDLPRSPLQARALKERAADAVDVPVKDAPVQTAPWDVLPPEVKQGASAMPIPRDEPSQGPVSKTSIDIRGKKREKIAALQGRDGNAGKSLSDLLDGEGSLKEQLGLDSMESRLAQPCMVCSQPRKRLEEIERALMMEQRPYKEVADRYNLTISDLNNHIEDCVLSRRAAIPAGALVNSLVNEINEFIQRLDAFRLELDSSMTTEAISSYLSVISQLQSSVKGVISMKSPDDEAIVVVKQVLNPMLLGFMREIAKGVKNFEDQITPTIMPGSEANTRKYLIEFVKRTGVSFTATLVDSIRKYCEVTGVNADVILGDMGKMGSTSGGDDD